jgi:hypothetical protein
MTEAGLRIEGAAGRCQDCGAVGTCYVQGETYSFGTEWWRLCDECADKASETGRCERCGKAGDDFRPVRDWEECCGFRDRVDWVCAECGGRERESFDAAMAGWAAYMREHFVEKQR